MYVYKHNITKIPTMTMTKKSKKKKQWQQFYTIKKIYIYCGSGTARSELEFLASLNRSTKSSNIFF